MANISLSAADQGLYGICGHVGVGHVHSHLGFVQDDSAGFAVAATILKKAVPISTLIKEVAVDLENGYITVVTANGGTGMVQARRGYTPAEQKLVQRAIGMDAVYTQNVAVNTFGRIYGQGAMETAVALQGACALAVMDSFSRALGDRLLMSKEKIADKYDRFAGTVVDIDGIPVSLMHVINGTDGGIGPDEDYEGNTDWEEKGQLMAQLGLDKVPTVVVESKAYIPSMAGSVSENQFMVRAQKDLDCTPLGLALYEAGKEQKLPIRFEDSIMPLSPGSLAASTKAIAEEIIKAAQELAEVDLASDKVRLLARLNRLVSEDAGGVTFMSNSVHGVMRGAGTLPGISAVISMVTTTDYKNYWKIPQVTSEDVENYIKIISAGIQSFKDNKN